MDDALADLRADCPACGMPEQHAGMPCAFCSKEVPIPRDVLAPDGTAKRFEEVIGWRAWLVDPRLDADMGFDGPRLRSPLETHIVWTPGFWTTAVCKFHGHIDPADSRYHGPDTDDPERWSPVKGCNDGGHGCGFYAGRTREHLIQLGYGRYSDDRIRVIGQVQMAGKIIPATNGFRAQRVMPRSILVPYEFWKLARDLKAVYGPHGIEVRTESTTVMPENSLPKWCAGCGAKLHRDPRCGICGHTHV